VTRLTSAFDLSFRSPPALNLYLDPLGPRVCAASVTDGQISREQHLAFLSLLPGGLPLTPDSSFLGRTLSIRFSRRIFISVIARLCLVFQRFFAN